MFGETLTDYCLVERCVAATIDQSSGRQDSNLRPLAPRLVIIRRAGPVFGMEWFRRELVEISLVPASWKPAAICWNQLKSPCPIAIYRSTLSRNTTLSRRSSRATASTAATSA